MKGVDLQGINLLEVGGWGFPTLHSHRCSLFGGYIRVCSI
jgi:hypothetical protein